MSSVIIHIGIPTLFIPIPFAGAILLLQNKILATFVRILIKKFKFQSRACIETLSLLKFWFNKYVGWNWNEFKTGIFSSINVLIVIKRIFTLYYLWNQLEMNWFGGRASNKRDGERWALSTRLAGSEAIRAQRSVNVEHDTAQMDECSVSFIYAGQRKNAQQTMMWCDALGCDSLDRSKFREIHIFRRDSVRSPGKSPRVATWHPRALFRSVKRTRLWQSRQKRRKRRQPAMSTSMATAEATEYNTSIRIRWAQLPHEVRDSWVK